MPPMNDFDIDSMPDMTGRSRGASNSMSNNIFEGRQRSSSDTTRSMSGDGTSTHVLPSGRAGNTLQQTANQNEEAALQKAIELSLRDVDVSTSSKHSTFEDSYLDRFIAQNEGESEGKQKRGHSSDYMTYSPVDPYRLLRKGDTWPVGLQNIGNTCWFNVVVQSLFHLPYFRLLLLKLPSTVFNSSITTETHRNLQLVHELRCLFALMISSKRSYVEPVKCVNILQEAFLARSNDSQQDASECIHMLLDQVEDACRYHQEIQIKNERHNSSSDSDITGNVFPALCPAKPPTNPMLELFYGVSKTVGVNNGNNFEQADSFSILPLCVKGHKSLHESLEHATARGCHDPLVNSQEVWIMRLPPVLTFQLSRFYFNQKTGKPEKLHDRLAFSSVFYMDRYLESNKTITREKREQVRDLRSKLREDKAMLSRLLNYPTNGDTYELTNVLSCCADYACEMHTVEASLAELQSPAKQCKRRLESNSPSEGHFSNKRSKEDEESMAEEIQFADSSINSPQPPPTDLGDISLASSLESEAQIVESVLRKWKLNVERLIADLRTQIFDAEQKLDRMYEEPILHHHPYSLHAVLVHQGQAMAGHYWAYIRDHSNQRWLKYNDVTVTEASFEQLNSDSMGNSRYSDYSNNASAYCLIYVDSKRTDLFRAEKDCIDVISSDSMLIKVINEHNQHFDDELDKWNLQQATKMSLEYQPKEDAEESPSKKQDRSSTCDKTGTWNLDDLKNAIDRVNQTYEAIGAEKALEKSGEEQTDEATRFLPRLYSDVVKDAKHCDKHTSDEIKLPPIPPEFVDEDEGSVCPILQCSILAIMKVGKSYNLDGPEVALLEAIGDEKQRLKQLAEAPASFSDPRLLNIIVYLYQNHAPRKVIERCILEQFTDVRLKYDTRSSDIMKCATEKLSTLAPSDLCEAEYKTWTELYHSFCNATCHLIYGLEHFHSRRYFEAVQHFATIHEHCHASNCGEESSKGVDVKLVGRYSRISIQRVHEEAVEMIRSSDRTVVEKGLEMMKKRLIPCLSILLTKSKGGMTDKDLKLADSIRDGWCSLIEQTIVLPRDQLSDALTELLDANPMCTQSIAIQHVEKPVNLFQRYEKVMSLFLQSNA